MIFNMVGGGGAGGASIFIVNSVNQRPTNVFNNTLWVNTDVDVVKYVFSDNEPSNPTEGMLWLTISNSDNVNVAAPINKDWMKFNLGIVRQYIDGVWERKLAQLYKDGIWVDVSKIFVAYIDITYPANSNCVVTNPSGQIVANDTNATSSPQTFTAIVGATGTYTVTATANDGSGNSKSQTVEITAEGQSVSVELSYGYYIFKSGVGFQNGYSVEFAKYQTIGTPTYDAQKIDFSAADIVNTGSAFIITPGINLSAYTTLFMDVDITATYSGNKYDINYGVGSYEANGNFGPSAAGNVMGTWAAIGTKAVQGNASRTTLELDISNVNSAQNIKFEAYAMTGYVYNIWLE